MNPSESALSHPAPRLRHAATRTCALLGLVLLAGESLASANAIGDDPSAASRLGRPAVTGPRLVYQLAGPEESATISRRIESLGEIAVFALTREGRTELWRSDGTTAGTYALLDGPDRPGAELDQPFFLVDGDRAFFLAFDTERSYRPALWVTDGTLAGTLRLADGIAPEAGSGFRSAALDRVLFVVFDFGADRASIWASDGTEAGTAPLSGFDSLPATIGVAQMVEDGSDLFVAFADPRTTLGTLWRVRASGMNGEPVVTALRADLPSTPHFLTQTADGLRFFVQNGGHSEIWRSNGTGAGTALQVTLPDGGVGESYGPIGGGVAFLYTTAGLGPQVWVSDGTAPGSRAVTSTSAPPPGRRSLDARNVDGRLLVFEYDPSTRQPRALFSLPDASSALAPLPVCSAGGQSCSIFPAALQPSPDGSRFLQACDQVVGCELWITDATPAGTRLVVDLCPGTCDSGLFPVARIGSTLFLLGDDGLTGRQFYTSPAALPLVLERVTDLGTPDWSSRLISGVAGSSLLFRLFDPADGLSLQALDVEEGLASCTPTAATLCLGDGRFALTVTWRDFQDRRGIGRAAALTADTGLFWFFDPDNVELIVKVLDARGVNGFYWVFYGALSNVEYTLTVTDTLTGASRTYENPAGVFASAGDTSALPGETLSGSRAGAEDSSRDLTGTGAEITRSPNRRTSTATGSHCSESSTTLCLNQGRFAVSVTWADFTGGSGVGRARQLTADTGSFWFFDPDNVELVVKVLDARGINGRFWVFYGALSNVAYSITVTDTETGATRVYDNEAGAFGSVGDTQAF